MTPEPTGYYVHECFFRGCHEIVADRYHCDRHVAILAARTAAQSRRNSENARLRREQPTRRRPAIREQLSFEGRA